MGISAGGFGLNIKTEDIAKFGTFLLNRGKWEGTQLLNPEWIDEATAKHIDNFGDANDWKQGYGYQFWRCAPEGVYRGDGAFGQYCIVMPEQDAVLAMQSGVDDMQMILTSIWDILLPAMKSSVSEDKETQQKLNERLKELTYAMPAGEASSPIASKVSGREYEISENIAGITKLVFEFGTATKVTFHFCENSYTAQIGYKQWVDGETFMKEEDENTDSPLYHHISCAGAWLSENVFQFEILYNRTTTKDIITVKFRDKGINVTCQRKFNFCGTTLNMMGW